MLRASAKHHRGCVGVGVVHKKVDIVLICSVYDEVGLSATVKV